MLPGMKESGRANLAASCQVSKLPITSPPKINTSTLNLFRVAALRKSTIQIAAFTVDATHFPSGWSPVREPQEPRDPRYPSFR